MVQTNSEDLVTKKGLWHTERSSTAHCVGRDKTVGNNLYYQRPIQEAPQGGSLLGGFRLFRLLNHCQKPATCTCDGQTQRQFADRHLTVPPDDAEENRIVAPKAWVPGIPNIAPGTGNGYDGADHKIPECGYDEPALSSQSSRARMAWLGFATRTSSIGRQRYIFVKRRNG